MAEIPPLLVRRIRAALRRLGSGGGGPIEGFVDSCVAGEIHGWAINPRQPNRRVHVIAVSDGQVVAEALANQHRADLVQDGRGDGRHAFRLRLPAALLDGERRSIQVRAMVGSKAVRLLRGEIELEPRDETASGERRTGGTAGVGMSSADAPPAALSLALWPSRDETPRRRRTGVYWPHPAAVW